MPRTVPSPRLDLDATAGNDSDIVFREAGVTKARAFWDESLETFKWRITDATAALWFEQGNTGNLMRMDPDGVTQIYAGGSPMLEIGTTYLELTNNGPTINVGTGTPESAVTAPVGSLFLRTDGGASTTLYVKESGSGNTGWVAK